MPNQALPANGSVVHAMQVYKLRPRTGNRGVDLISDALQFSLPKLRSAISVEQGRVQRVVAQ